MGVGMGPDGMEVVVVKLLSLLLVYWDWSVSVGLLVWGGGLVLVAFNASYRC